jgi:hypothetical protein
MNHALVVFEAVRSDSIVDKGHRDELSRRGIGHGNVRCRGRAHCVAGRRSGAAAISDPDDSLRLKGEQWADRRSTSAGLPDTGSKS